MPGVSYRDLRGDWIQELIDKRLVDPLPNRISIYQVLVTGGYGPYTGEWVRKYPPEKLVNLITENLEI
nr:MAG TPA: hypothetical protein [Caudoviricetes sp.]